MEIERKEKENRAFSYKVTMGDVIRDWQSPAMDVRSCSVFVPPYYKLSEGLNLFFSHRITSA